MNTKENTNLIKEKKFLNKLKENISIKNIYEIEINNKEKTAIIYFD